MKQHTDNRNLTLLTLLAAVVLIVSGTVGCRTSQQTPKVAIAPKLVAPHPSGPHPSEAVQPPRPDSTQTCRATLHQIEGAKRVWALENRKPDSAMPVDADLFGPDAPLREKPKCPSGGTYTLRAVEVPPLCSIPGHVY